jgi:hypothetical protein
MRTSLALAMLAAAARTAAGDPGTPVRLADGITLEVTRDALLVHRGALTARLAAPSPRRYFGDAAPVIDRRARTIQIEELDRCSDVGDPLVRTFDQAASRLDNVAALGLHRRHQYAAAAGFAQALAEDPHNRVAAQNLASAQQLLGQRAAAVATLGPWLQQEPESMYAAIVADPELSPLLTEPALAALAAQASGPVTTLAAYHDGIAYAPARHQLAVWRDECSWGYDGSDACGTSIELFDVATGRRITALPLAEILDHAEPGLRARRADAAARTLRDLGFRATAVITARDTTNDASRADDKRTFSFPSLHLGVVSREGAVNVLRGDTSLATAETLTRLHGARYVPAAQVLVLSSGRAGHEGCEGTDPTATDLIPLALAAP